jgi:hypothetical protein
MVLAGAAEGCVIMPLGLHVWRPCRRSPPRVSRAMICPFTREAYGGLAPAHRANRPTTLSAPPGLAGNRALTAEHQARRVRAPTPFSIPGAAPLAPTALEAARRRTSR